MKNRDTFNLKVVYNGEACMSLHKKYKSEKYLLISRQHGKLWTELLRNSKAILGA